MWYGSTKNLLESIVRWLRTERSQGDATWQSHTELVQACLAEMVEMSEPTVNPSQGATSRYVHRPVADKLNRAMPHIRSMLTDMRDRAGCAQVRSLHCRTCDGFSATPGRR
jgi:hypothetical protein